MSARYAAAYPVYRDLGWSPIKLKAPTKWPPPTGFTGHDGRDPSGADMYTWAEEEPGGNVAIRVPGTVVGIDADHYDGKTGAATIAEGEKRWGRLPYSPKSTSRDDGSGIRLYRVPPGTRLVEKLKFPELGLGGVDIIQRHHRYVMCWPSVHPEGPPYRWLGIDGGELDSPPALSDIPDLPAAWLEGLTEPNPGPAPGAEFSGDDYDINAALTTGEPTPRVAQKLGQAILACRGGNRHDDVRNAVLGLLRCGKQGDGGVLPPLKVLRDNFVDAVASSRPGGKDEAKGEFNKFVFSERTAKRLADPAYDDLGGDATTFDPKIEVEDWADDEGGEPTEAQH